MPEATAFLKLYNIEAYPTLANIHYDEVKRYAGMGRGIEGIDIDKEMNVLEECIKEALPLLCYKVSFRRDYIIRNGTEIKLPFNYFGSKDILTNLTACDEVVMFAGTIGIGIDRLIAKYNRISPVKALFLQAFGAERIEALCNLFNSEIRNEAIQNGRMTRPRYSPGYGDLPLEVQKEFVTILDCSRRLGVTLNESLLMSPSKSVTAIIGIGPGDVAGIGCDKYISTYEIEHDCSKCSKTDCEWRG